MLSPALFDSAATTAENARKPLLLSQAAQARAVFVGQLVAVGPPPGAWSGLVLEYQRLDFQVQDALKGEVAPGAISVYQLIVALSPLAERDAPRLLARYTEVGQRYVVLLGAADKTGREITASDTVGLTVATDALVAELRTALGTR